MSEIGTFLKVGSGVEISPEAKTEMHRPFRRGHPQSQYWLHLSAIRKFDPGNSSYTRGDQLEPSLRFVASAPNSIGLPSEVTCPGSTSFCAAYCYGTSAEPQRGVSEGLERNLRLMHEAATTEAITILYHEALTRYENFANRHRIPPNLRIFRHHWDGDIFSREQAQAITNTAHLHPGVKFWVYTRSFQEDYNYLPALMGVGNLAVYASVDQDNIDVALQRAQEFGNLLFAYCGVDYAACRELEAYANSRGRRPTYNSIVCPENRSQQLVNDAGVGACVSCMVCPDARRDIYFAASHSEHSDGTPAAQSSLPGLSVPVVMRSRR